MKTKKLSIPIYYGVLVIHKAKNLSEIGKKYNMNFQNYAAVVWRDEKKKYLNLHVAFAKNTKPDVIAHEITHLVNHVFTHTGTKLDPYNDEPQAYLTGWFMKKISKFLKK